MKTILVCLSPKFALPVLALVARGGCWCRYGDGTIATHHVYKVVRRHWALSASRMQAE